MQKVILADDLLLGKIINKGRFLKCSNLLGRVEYSLVDDDFIDNISSQQNFGIIVTDSEANVKISNSNLQNTGTSSVVIGNEVFNTSNLNLLLGQNILLNSNMQSSNNSAIGNNINVGDVFFKNNIIEGKDILVFNDFSFPSTSITLDNNVILANDLTLETRMSSGVASTDSNMNNVIFMGNYNNMFMSMINQEIRNSVILSNSKFLNFVNAGESILSNNIIITLTTSQTKPMYTVKNSNIISIGDSIGNNGANSISIGHGANALGEGSVAIGYNAKTDEPYSTVFSSIRKNVGNCLLAMNLNTNEISTPLWRTQADPINFTFSNLSTNLSGNPTVFEVRLIQCGGLSNGTTTAYLMFVYLGLDITQSFPGDVFFDFTIDQIPNISYATGNLSTTYGFSVYINSNEPGSISALTTVNNLFYTYATGMIYFETAP